MGLWDDIVRRGITGQCKQEVPSIDRLICVGSWSLHAYIGIFFTKPGSKYIYMLYPLSYTSDDNIELESGFCSTPASEVRIRQATAEEISRWKNATGKGVTIRKKLKNENDVRKQLGKLSSDIIIITEL